MPRSQTHGKLDQVLGRLCGIDERTQDEGKILWAPQQEIDKLLEGLHMLPFIVSKIEKNTNFPQLLREAKQDILTNNKGNYQDTEEVARFDMSKWSRGGVNSDAQKGVQGMATAAKECGIPIVAATSGYVAPFASRIKVPAAAMAPVALVVAPVVRVAPVAPIAPALRDLTAREEMDEVWANHASVIARAMEDIVGKGSITLSGMVSHLPAHRSFPQGTSFSISTFVRHICGTTDVLERFHLAFDGKVFSKAYK